MARGTITSVEVDGEVATIKVQLDPKGELSSTQKTYVLATGRQALPNGMAVQVNVTRKNEKFKK